MKDIKKEQSKANHRRKDTHAYGTHHKNITPPFKKRKGKERKKEEDRREKEEEVQQHVETNRVR